MTADDITDTLAPKSDQMDAIELVQPRTFTVSRVVVKKGDDQPVNVFLAEFDRPWRPSKNQRRVLAAIWGSKSSAWVGGRMTLFCDSEVMFGGRKVGGIRISHMSGIGKRTTVPILASQGRPEMYMVEPLREDRPAPTPTDPITALRAEWQTADEDRRKVIEAEVARLQAEQEGE